MLSGCSLINQLVGERANGIIVYGNKETIEKEAKSFKEDLTSFKILEAKLFVNNDQKTLILNQSAATDLLHQGLFREVKKDKTVILKSLPAVTKNQSILFGKELLKEASDSLHSNMKAAYHGNVIIGSARHYVDSFVIVEDSLFNELSAETLYLGILLFNNPSQSEHSMQRVQDLAPQLVTIVPQEKK